MHRHHPLATELNGVLSEEYPLALRLLSDRGRRIYFPRTGILGQTGEAKGSKINATIGIALEDDGTPMHYRQFDGLLSLPAKEIYPYAPAFGVPEFRAAWRAQILGKNPSMAASISLPVVTSGLTHALSSVGFLFCDTGDEVLITDLHWDNCELIFEENLGAQIVPFQTFTNGGLHLGALREALSVGGRGKKILLLNFPNNPSGYSPTADEAHAIAQILKTEAQRGSDIVVLLDDAYFGFFHDAHVYRESLGSLLGDLHENILVAKIDGPTKEDCTWGHRIGCITFAGKGMTPGAAQALEAKVAGVVRSTVSCAPHLPQRLLLQLYRSETYTHEHQRIVAALGQRYERVLDVLRDPRFARHFRPLPFNAGYFLCVELINGLQGEVVRRRLLAEHSTAVIAFGPLLRIAYSSLPEAKIAELFEHLYDVCSHLSAVSPSPQSHAFVVAGSPSLSQQSGTRV